MTLRSDWGMEPMMIQLMPEVNRAFSAKIIWGTFGFLGRRPRLEMRSRLWRLNARINEFGAGKHRLCPAPRLCAAKRRPRKT
jgi:hypothetical protein